MSLKGGGGEQFLLSFWIWYLCLKFVLPKGDFVTEEVEIHGTLYTLGIKFRWQCDLHLKTIMILQFNIDDNLLFREVCDT